MKKFKHHTLKEYSQVLSMRTPIPGGGSAAAYAAALGVSLLSMVANYSLGKSSRAVDKQLKKILKENEKVRARLLDLVDLDAQAYLKVVKTKTSAPAIRRKALKEASDVPREVSRHCYRMVQQAPFLVAKGNKYLISDVEVAVEFLLAAFHSSMINVRVNQ